MSAATQAVKRQATTSSAQPRFPTSLRSTLVATFVLLSVLPVASALLLEMDRFGAQAEQQVTFQLNSIIETKEDAIAVWLEQNQEKLEPILADDVDSANVVELLSSSEPSETLRTNISKHLTAMRETQDDFTEYFLYDLDGEIAASTDSAQIGKVVTLTPYFAPSLQGEHVEAPFYEVGSASLAMIVTRPVLDTNGEVVGVLAGRLNLDQLGGVMTQRAGLGKTGETYLVSLENNYFVTPSRFEGYSLTRSYQSEGINRALAGETGTSSYNNYRDKPVIGAYTWLPDLEVGLVAEIERTEAFAALQAAIQTSIIVATAAAVIAAGIGFIAALRITRPITELTDVTRQFSEGDLDARTRITRRNEIGELGYAFNTMAGRQQETLVKLEASVKEARLATAMAREANRLKSEFLATMSHELRTPLNAIIGFAEILLAGMTGPISEKVEHKLSRIHLNSRRLLELINNLLDLAKIEAGRVDVLHEPFSPAQIATTLQAEMESLAERKGLAFRVLIDPRLPPQLVGDAMRIEQAASNLLSNAFKFTNKGEVTLRFDAEKDETWSVSVTDTGIGIPPHALEYIFDEFRQVDSGSQRAYGGSGLGLAITRNLARIMGGDIRVSSKLGEGSTFTISLPLVVPQAELVEAVI